MNLVTISVFTLANEYKDIADLVSNNKPLTENTIPMVLNRCEEYAKKHNLMFLYPMGLTPIYFIFREKTPKKKRN